jgi:hypothetical protein
MLFYLDEQMRFRQPLQRQVHDPPIELRSEMLRKLPSDVRCIALTVAQLPYGRGRGIQTMALMALRIVDYNLFVELAGETIRASPRKLAYFQAASNRPLSSAKFRINDATLRASPRVPVKNRARLASL